MRCPICDNTEKWEDVTSFRDDDDQSFKDPKTKEIKSHNMQLCQSCGFVGYPDRQKNEEELKQYYRSNYRDSRPPTVTNTFTGQRKLYYHETFLRDLLKEWQQEGLTKPKFLEVGAAFGLVPFWFKQIFPEAEVYGTELTLKYRRVAFHEYGVRLDEEFDDTKKYDLIVSYKVLEHQVDPDKQLRRYAECLTENGRLYISVPTWFKELSNFGVGGFDLPYYYHPDHINVWTQTLFETLLKKAGLEVVKFDDKVYGETYLCKRNDELMKENPVFESPSEIKKQMETIKKSWVAFKANDFETAKKLFPNCPHYWAGWYEKNRKELHSENFEELLEKVCRPLLEVSKRSKDALTFAADICMRYEQWNDAIELLNEVNAIVPNYSRGLAMLAHSLRGMSNSEPNPERKIKMIANAKAVSDHLSKVDLQAYNEAVNWKFRDASDLPTPWEIEEAKQFAAQRSEYDGKARSENRGLEGNL